MVRLGQIQRPAVEVGDVATPGGRCPACGQPLFAWLEVDGDVGAARVRHVLDRCENCKLVIERGDAGEGVADLIEGLVEAVAKHGEATVALPNGVSWQAGIGSENWSGLRFPSQPSVLNPKALALLLEHEGLEAGRVSYPAAPAMATLMQTLINLITLNRDFARRVLGGELKSAEARHGRGGYAFDVFATAITAIPVAALSVLIEGAALLARRGGVFKTTVRRSAG
jgi:hypothetical protein